MKDEYHVLNRVRRALGRGPGPTSTPPAPPVISPVVARLVHTTTGLPELFAQRAAELKMIVTETSSSDAAAKLLAFVRKHPIKSIAMSVSPLLQRLRLREALTDAGLTVKSWDEMTLDELYEFDCAITDVDHAVAESGTIVIKPTQNHGRGLSLVPMYHIAFVEPGQILPDMVDLFDRLVTDEHRSNVILISGPSKTADIEMNVVTGVHGPNVVNTFILKGESGD
ncbi:MAG: LUD domain-containing protein [Tepidisphaeraceae bacterium]